jgi:predicted component of type VI protein secretion system
MKVSLVVNQGKPEGKEIPIRLNQFLIGRDADCHLRPASPMVSKRHCALLIRDGKVFLRDFDSTNGTFVNDRPLKGETELRDGDRFRVGPLSFTVKITITAVDKPTPLPPTAPAKAAAATTPTGAAGGPLSEEDVFADMLLNLDGGPAGAGTADGNDPIPPGSTIMQIPANLSQQGEQAGEPPPEGAAPKKEETRV